MNIRAAITLVAIILVSLVNGQSLKNTKLDSFFNLLSDHQKAMGSFVISQNGSIIYNKVFGYRYYSDHQKIPADVNTKYRVGSVSKLFTATIIFQLVEEGKVKLNTTIDTYFPGLPNGNLITLGHLLNHRSGLHNFRSVDGKDEPKSHEELLQTLYKSKIEFQPGSKAAYSNSNYVLLGYIVEKICNKSFELVLTERIANRIGLQNTYCGKKTDLDNNESYSYKLKKTWMEQPQTDMSITGGTGSIVSNPTDLAKFIESLFSFKLVNEQSLNMMRTITDGFGMGIIPLPFFEKIAYGHYGGIDNFISVLAYFPEEAIAVAYCTNGEVFPVKDILETALSIYFDKDYSMPVFNDNGVQN